MLRTADLLPPTRLLTLGSDPMKTTACTGPGAMVGIPVNVATVDGWKTTRTGLDSRGEDLVGGVL